MTKRVQCAAFLFLFFCSLFGVAADRGKVAYPVEAIRYGTIKDFPVSGLVLGADKSRKTDIAMVYWLDQGNRRKILVDSRFYHPQFFAQVEDSAHICFVASPCYSPSKSWRCDRPVAETRLRRSLIGRVIPS
jgi:hypothetical protein